MKMWNVYIGKKYQLNIELPWVRGEEGFVIHDDGSDASVPVSILRAFDRTIPEQFDCSDRPGWKNIESQHLVPASN